MRFSSFDNCKRANSYEWSISRPLSDHPWLMRSFTSIKRRKSPVKSPQKLQRAMIEENKTIKRFFDVQESQFQKSSVMNPVAPRGHFPWLNQSHFFGRSFERALYKKLHLRPCSKSQFSTKPGFLFRTGSLYWNNCILHIIPTWLMSIKKKMCKYVTSEPFLCP